MSNTIVIVGGGLKKDKNGWRTTNFNEGDDFGIIGDRLRVVAGSFLFKDNSDSSVVVLGGRGQLINTDAPEVSSVLKEELIELGVPGRVIIEDGESGNTYQQLQELQRILTERQTGSVTIISNEYHLPRIEAMVKYSQKLAQLKDMISRQSLVTCSAESVLLKYDKQNWEKIITEAYQSEAMKDRIKSEQQGVAQIKSEIYKLI